MIIHAQYVSYNEIASQTMMLIMITNIYGVNIMCVLTIAIIPLRPPLPNAVLDFFFSIRRFHAAAER